MPQNTKSFTTEHAGLTNELVTESLICQAIDPSNRDRDKDAKQQFRKYYSIWDTGATNSAISQKVVDECGLKSTGMANVSHVDGTSHCETYLVTILLRNNVVVSQVKVTKANLGPNTDVLIGMDIITLGDFAVTNKDGKTVFSFRTPSVECIDFSGQIKSAKVASQTSSTTASSPGRNSICSCGSGKKYKNCCGKRK